MKAGGLMEGGRRGEGESSSRPSALMKDARG